MSWLIYQISLVLYFEMRIFNYLKLKLNLVKTCKHKITTINFLEIKLKTMTISEMEKKIYQKQQKWSDQIKPFLMNNVF